MGEFFAWAATGIVVGLQSWSRDASRVDEPRLHGHQAPTLPISNRQRFFLRQQNGRDIEILLVDSGIAFRNGHAVTAVWAAREKAAYGHCIYLENHTTGAIARLQENLAVIRRKASWRQIGIFGFLATFPATLILVGWLYMQRAANQNYDNYFLISASVAAILLLIIGIVASKLIFDYLRTEDERRIWVAADKALFHARRLLIQKPRSRYYV
ncbi:MAG: hypothetical protein ACFCUR_15500 [Rhodomicrobiaceae bacterium]